MIFPAVCHSTQPSTSGNPTANPWPVPKLIGCARTSQAVKPARVTTMAALVNRSAPRSHASRVQNRAKSWRMFTSPQ